MKHIPFIVGGLVAVIALVAGGLAWETSLSHIQTVAPIMSTTTSSLPATTSLSDTFGSVTTASSTPPTASSTNDSVVINSIHSGQSISSPITITGTAPNMWYFEAAFPVNILDGNGKLLGHGSAAAQSDWTLAGPVPFKVILSFSTSTTASGSIVFENDNPSGLASTSKMLTLPVIFSKTGVTTQSTSTTASSL